MPNHTCLQRCADVRAEDVTDTIELALAASGCDQAVVRHKPRLLSDNGSCYISGDLAKWLEDQKMTHVRGAPLHPQTQGKIERWHQTMKNRVLLENYYLPGDLERQIGAFVEYYNNQRLQYSNHMLSKHISLISITREFRSNDLPMKLLLGFRNPQIKIVSATSKDCV